MWLTRVDFPEPETPAMQVNVLIGILALNLFKL